MRLRRGGVNALTNRIHIMYNNVESRDARFYLAESTRWVCRLTCQLQSERKAGFISIESILLRAQP